jgi:hypothetical protein
MDVRGAAGIRHGPDGAKPVSTLTIGYYLPIALEIVVEWRVRAIVSDIMVVAGCVALPNLDA